MKNMNKNNIDVSVIIVSWNVRDIISECIDSLRNYTDLNCEIIIVDNASSDGTCELIKDKYKDVELIELKENIGFSKANNVGLEKAAGKYIFYLNPDVIFIQDIMSSMINKLENNKDIGIVSPRLLNKDKTLQLSYSNFISTKKILFDDFKLHVFLNDAAKIKYCQTKVKSNDTRIVDWTYGAAHLCRHSDVVKIGGYPDSYFMYGEDTELCMAFKKQLNMKVLYCADLELIHLGGYSEKQVLNSKKIIYGTNATLYFMEKYYDYKYAVKLQKLLLLNYKLRYYVMNFICLLSKDVSNKNKREKFRLAYETTLKYKIQGEKR